jgi:hypothetical protein
MATWGHQLYMTIAHDYPIRSMSIFNADRGQLGRVGGPKRRPVLSGMRQQIEPMSRLVYIRRLQDLPA